MQPKWLRIVIHFIAWLLFFSLPLVFEHRHHQGEHVETMFDFNYYRWPVLLCDALLIVFFYINYNLLIPNYFLKRKFWSYFTIITFSLLSFIALPIKWESSELEAAGNDIEALEQFHQLKNSTPLSFEQWEKMEKIEHEERERNWGFATGPIHFFESSIFLFLLIWLMSSGLRMSSFLYGIAEHQKESAAEKTKSELNLLKMQVNPHFLFNTLNNIYSLVMLKDERASAAVLKLSELMRYQLEQSNNEKVALDKEIRFIENYVELQGIRLSEKACIEFKCENKNPQAQIAPLVLITFIENAFKHGISTHEKSKIKIELLSESNHLQLLVNNQIFQNLKEEAPSGLGLENVKRRLQLAYPDKHHLTINKSESSFEVLLKINLV